MKIKLISDLHIEFGVDYKTADFSDVDDADVLVLAGDVSSGAGHVADVLDFYSDRFLHVVYVPGNHEYYGTTVKDFDKALEDYCCSKPNVHLLNPNKVQIDDVLFVGASLWTNFGNDWFAQHSAKDMISDFRAIKNFSTDEAIDLYLYHFNYIADAVEGSSASKTCVVTHFLPAQACIAPEYQNPNDLLNKYFANSLDNWIFEHGPDIWMFGHTHTPVDVTIGNTQLVCNPRGYPRSREGKFFNPHFKVIV